MNKTHEQETKEPIGFDGKLNKAFSDINTQIQQHIDKTFCNTNNIRWMAESLLKDGYLKISNIVPDSVKRVFHEDVRSLLSQFAKRRDIHIEVYW